MKDFYPEGFKSLLDKESFTSEVLLKAKQNERVLEGAVKLCQSNHDLIVDLGEIKGIIKREEGAIGIAEGKIRDIALISRVGKTVTFTVEELTEEKGQKVAYLSRRKAQEKFLDYFYKNVKIGDITDAVVTHLESFGVFCDIGCGMVALLPIDLISVSRISHPSDRFSVGDKIKVIVKQIASDGKITVSHKELLGSWQENADLFEGKQTVTGVVRSVEDYGVFVELSPNLAGLAEPFDTKVGNKVSVYIKSIIKEKMKVKLIIIDSFEEKYSPPIKYFYKEEHIDRFDYSPSCSQKQIYTLFE